MEKYINNFLNYLEVRNCSKSSLKIYNTALHNFIGFSGIHTPGKITFQKVTAWQKSLSDQGNCANTIANKSTALRSFLFYLLKNGVKSLNHSSVELPKIKQILVTFLSEKEIKQILEAPDTRGFRGLRDKTILELFCSTGMRLSELSSLRVKQINLLAKEIIIKGKGRVRKVFLNDSAAYWLKRYLYNHKDQTILFPITQREIQRMIKRYTVQAGIDKKVSPHVFRRSIASLLLKNGLNLFEVKKILGHASIATTDRYLNTTDEDLHNNFKKASEDKKDSIEERLIRIETMLKKIMNGGD